MDCLVESLIIMMITSVDILAGNVYAQLFSYLMKPDLKLVSGISWKNVRMNSGTYERGSIWTLWYV